MNLVRLALMFFCFVGVLDAISPATATSLGTDRVERYKRAVDKVYAAYVSQPRQQE